MARDLPSLNAIRMFEAAAQHRNFTRAAEQLFVTQGAVSRQIKQLERELKQELFIREGPKLELTSAGEHYYRSVQQGLGVIRRGTLELRRQSELPVLVISVLPSFAAKWLIPRIVDFQEFSEQIEIQMVASYEPIDFVHRPDIDVAIRFGQGGWSDTYSECLINEDMFPVCSPSFLSRSPALKQPADLLDQPLIYASSEYNQWIEWFEAAGVDPPTNFRGTTYSDELMIQQAAIEGQGVALVRSLLVNEELQAGRLARLFDTSICSKNSYYFVCPSYREEEPNIAFFLQWLRDKALETDAACQQLRAI